MRATLSVPEVHCGHCKSSIEGALSQLNGVTRAEVDLAARTVTVDYDDSQVERDTVVATITSIGYEVAEA